MTMQRRDLVRALGAAVAASLAGRAAWAAPASPLTTLNRDWLVSEAEALEWHRFKDAAGPALAGNASWRSLMTFLEAKLKDYGCVDVHRSAWTYDRLETSVWPDDSKWGLVSAGRRVPVANHGANCGTTGPAGVTAPLVVWDPETKPNVAGKIVVFRPVPRPEVRDAFADSDYESRTPFDSWPVEGRPVPQARSAVPSISDVVWDEMTATSVFIQQVRDRKPAGVVFAMNLNRALTAGLFTFGVPADYDFPSVYVDRADGDAVIADARAGRSATLRVEGRRVPSETYQLVAYLPGRDYGAPNDQQIQLRTHTDGPSISQDDGAFGLLGVVKYFGRVPRKDRSRTLMIELDCRHFMPGMERAWGEQDYFAKNPGARDKIVAMVAMEHLGQIEYVADGEDIKPSGRSMETWVYSSPDPGMLEAALKAMRENDVRAAVIRSPGRPGVNGKSQGPWYGMSGGGQYLGLPTYGVQGDLGAYWAHSAKIDRFDARSFTRQVAAFTQLVGYLMTATLPKVPKVERQPLPPAFR
jgi:hypothetical protein